MKHIFTVIFVFTFFISCTQKENSKISELKDIYGSIISLSDTIMKVVPPNDFLIFAYLDSIDCVPCAIEKYTMLSFYKKDFESFDTGLVFVIKGKEKDEIREMFSTILFDIDHKLIFDAGQFENDNLKVLSNPLAKTFIIDKEKKIIWLGWPIQDGKSYERYKELMSILMNNKIK